MKGIRFQIIFCIIILLYGCKTSQITTRWKAEHFSQVNHNNILVVGIIKDENVSFRKKIETDFISGLGGLNYHAVSALNQFGPKSLSNLGEAETYIKLCNSGIDAVITIALIDEEKDENKRSPELSDYPAKHYYERIWNYKNIQGELMDKYPVKTSYFWEIILFDLVTLQPQCTFQTRSFNPATESMNDEFLKQIIQKMVKKKVLFKKKNRTATQPKPF